MDGERLRSGAYEALVTDAIAELLESVDGFVHKESLDPGEAAARLSDHVRRVVERRLREIPSKERPHAQIALTNELARQVSVDGAASSLIAAPGEVLRLIAPPLLPGQQPPALPDVPLTDHDVLANAPGEPSFIHALNSELESADRVDAVIAFIRWSGLNLLRDAIELLKRNDVPLRVLTTTFTGSTERKALDWLVDQGAQVRVSYDTQTTRLHAKAWLIHRDTGYSTAYVGSSNLSRSALVDGIEWNVRLAEASAPATFEKLRATFDSLWNDDSSEPYDPEYHAELFDRAIARINSGATVDTIVSGLDVIPKHYQREILEALIVERERFGRSRNLIVAPTGTGKTVVAALDYQALRHGDGGVDVGKDPSLLFVAHREQLLDQSLRTFRDVLKRGDFGEKFVGGHRPQEWRHVFASIQSLHSMDVEQLAPDAFDVIYVDEFHHAEASTYRKLLDHVRPQVLIGLTATPERTDGLNVRERYFDDRYAFEMRLWDALDQQLLVPFHYFGISDGTDLSALKWERGGYRTSELESLYVVTGHDARLSKVLAALRDRVADTSRMRAFGFCVSVAHAEYMARRFTEQGIPAVAMSGETSFDERREQLNDLRARRINVVFAVDVLTEGVDVPEVDTLLLLRPTESATVFLQQLGRGLRHSEGKSVCTVLDFLGQQHRKFRTDLRLRAVTGRSRAELIKDVETDFPYLPSGCHIVLDRQAEAHILDNLRAVMATTVVAMARELRELEAHRGRLTLDGFLTEMVIDLDDVYRSSSSWTLLRRRAKVEVAPAGPREEELAKALRLRFQDVDDPERIGMLRLLGSQGTISSDPRSQRLAAMIGQDLFDDGNAPESVEGVVEALSGEPATRQELLELADVLESRANVLTRPTSLPPEVPLQVHATYSRSQVLVALGDRELGQKTAMREGVKYLRDLNMDLFFVTLEKSERLYSPTTRYADYAVARDLFHWESQSTTTRNSPTGHRYLEGTSKVLLFVRRTNKLATGRTPGFVFLGPVSHVEDRGERPIQITWKLEHPMPERWFQFARAVAG